MNDRERLEAIVKVVPIQTEFMAKKQWARSLNW
jgi:hypothetical protein